MQSHLLLHVFDVSNIQYVQWTKMFGSRDGVFVPTFFASSFLCENGKFISPKSAHILNTYQSCDLNLIYNLIEFVYLFILLKIFVLIQIYPVCRPVWLSGFGLQRSDLVYIFMWSRLVSLQKGNLWVVNLWFDFLSCFLCIWNSDFLITFLLVVYMECWLIS